MMHRHLILPALMAGTLLTVSAAVEGKVDKSSLRCWTQ